MSGNSNITGTTLLFEITTQHPTLNFGSREEGYPPVDPVTVAVQNTGNVDVALNQLPAVTGWTLTPGIGWGTLQPSATTTFTIRPNTGLPADEYAPTIHITGSGGANATINPTFTVTDASVFAISADPAAPDLGSLVEWYAAPSNVTVVMIRNEGNRPISLAAFQWNAVPG